MATKKNPGGGTGSVGTPPPPGNPGGATGSIGGPVKKPNPNPGGGTGKIPDPAPKKPSPTNPGGATGTVGTPTAPATKPAPSKGGVTTGPGAWPTHHWPSTTAAPVTVPAAPAPTTTAPAAPAPTADQQSAKADVIDALNQYGLGALADWAWQKILNGENAKQILVIDAPQTQAFKDRFPAIGKLQTQGVAITPADYITYQKDAISRIHDTGLDTSQYASSSAIDKLIASQVSPTELQSRLDTLKGAVLQAPLEARQYLQQNLGIGNGDMAGFFLNPDNALPALQMKADAAAIGGAAAQTGFGYLDVQKALQLAGLGVSATQAQAGFGKIATQQELTQNLGDGTGSVSNNDLIDAQLGGNGIAATKMAKVAAQRLAEFSNGGSYAQTQGGITGLGVGDKGFGN